jgi:hypothetical protein
VLLAAAVTFFVSGMGGWTLTIGRRPGARDAALRAQEARVYERTGSRFFQLPHCPEEPQDPPDVPILDIIDNWNPDDVAIPARHHSTLCRIDYQAERAKAFRYRDADVPFVVYNVPAFDETVRKWAQPGYVDKQLGPADVAYPVEISKSNHFLYVSLSQKSRENFQQVTGKELPLTRAEWSYMRWLDEAQKAEQAKADGVPVRQQSHAYLYVADDRNRRIRQEELTIFHRDKNGSLFVADPAGPRLIECRFAMRGIVTEGHYDGERNMAGVVSGLRRWILAHPSNCPHAYLRPQSDFSARQSSVDWARPDLEKYPEFAKMRAHEVVLMPGEVLHVPSWWLHYVVTLDTGAQCNAHCGKSEVGAEHIEACGFKRPTPKPAAGASAAGRKGK